MVSTHQKNVENLELREQALQNSGFWHYMEIDYFLYGTNALTSIKKRKKSWMGKLFSFQQNLIGENYD